MLNRVVVFIDIAICKLYISSSGGNQRRYFCISVIYKLFPIGQVKKELTVRRQEQSYVLVSDHCAFHETTRPLENNIDSMSSFVKTEFLKI